MTNTFRQKRNLTLSVNDGLGFLFLGLWHLKVCCIPTLTQSYVLQIKKILLHSYGADFRASFVDRSGLHLERVPNVSGYAPYMLWSSFIHVYIRLPTECFSLLFCFDST